MNRQQEALAFLRNALHRCDQEGIDPKETVVNVYQWYQQEHINKKTWKKSQKKWRRMSDAEPRPAIGTKVRIAKDIDPDDLMFEHVPGDIITITGWNDVSYGVLTGFDSDDTPCGIYWLHELEIEE